jgi:hypothetical protein
LSVPYLSTTGNSDLPICKPVSTMDQSPTSDKRPDERVTDDWLLTSFVKSGRKLCHEFLYKGTCKNTNPDAVPPTTCSYSHDPEDIEMFHKAKALGPGAMQTLTPKKQTSSGSSSGKRSDRRPGGDASTTGM